MTNKIIGSEIEATLEAILQDAQAWLESGKVNSGIQNLVTQLYGLRKELNDDVFQRTVVEACLAHPIREYIHQDPTQGVPLKSRVDTPEMPFC